MVAQKACGPTVYGCARYGSFSQAHVDASPFDAVAPVYDRTFTWSLIGRAQREITTRALDRLFRPGQRILELNCGTGVDAVHLASRGIEVLACDISSRMIEEARQRAAEALHGSLSRSKATFRVLATEDIGMLRQEGLAGHFDGAFSSFAGLNCVEDLSAVAGNLETLLRPGARVLLCLFGRFCLWEMLWYLGRAMPAKAFRRLRVGGAIGQVIEGVTVNVHYPSVRDLTRMFAPQFRLKRWKGVGVAIPPTYLDELAQRFPRLLGGLAHLDPWLAWCPLLRATGDHVLLTFERRS
jgi:SAM-dependent methyltransferase